MVYIYAAEMLAPFEKEIVMQNTIKRPESQALKIYRKRMLKENLSEVGSQFINTMSEFKDLHTLFHADCEVERTEATFNVTFIYLVNNKQQESIIAFPGEDEQTSVEDFVKRLRQKLYFICYNAMMKK